MTDIFMNEDAKFQKILLTVGDKTITIEITVRDNGEVGRAFPRRELRKRMERISPVEDIRWIVGHAPGGRIARTALKRRAPHIPAEAMDEALGALLESGEIIERFDRPKRGPKTTFYEAVA